MNAARLLEAVEAFVRDEVLPNVSRWDLEDDLPAAVLERLWATGLPGALVAPDYGGAGLPVVDLVPSWRALSRGWISLTGAVNPTGLAVALLSRFGTEAQRSRWLPGIARGEVVASFSITEPQAGSDLRLIETTAELVDGGGLRLDGEKRWIAGGVSSDVVFMFCSVVREPGGEGEPSCVILPAEGRDGPGWAVGEIDKVGYRGVESAAYRFSGFLSQGAEVLGGSEGIGLGARFMLDALDVGRINVACRALGILDRCLGCALEECVEREVGGSALGDHTHAQMRVGEMRVDQAAGEALVMRAAAAVDARSGDARDLAIAAKLSCSQAALLAVERAARLAASRSYAARDELARLRRDAPQTLIGEGANDALLLALGRGAIDAVSG